MKRFVIAYVVLVLLVISSSTFNMYGKRCLVVTDEESQPISEAIVSVCDSTENINSRISITGEDGSVCINNYSPRSIIEVRALGFISKSYRQDECPDTVILNHESTELQEFTVSATRDVISQKSGKFIFTPGSLKTEVSNIYSLIAYVPLVDFNNGVFSIIGKRVGAQIYINGMPPREWGSGVDQALKSLPATMIKRVEIIPDAGSRESASSSGGIINIVVDLPNEGALHRLNAAVGYATKLSSNASYWLGIMKARFKVSGNFKFGSYANESSSEDYYNYIDQNKTVAENTSNLLDCQSLSAGLSVSYNTSSTGSVGLSASVQTDHEWNSIFTTGQTSINDNQQQIRSSNTTRTPWHSPAWGYPHGIRSILVRVSTRSI